jgi:hypothetical protein
VLGIKLNAGDQIVVCYRDRVGLFTSRRRAASNDVSADHVSSQPGLASAFAGMRPLRSTMNPPVMAATMVAKTPNTNPLNITVVPSRIADATRRHVFYALPLGRRGTVGGCIVIALTGNLN